MTDDPAVSPPGSVPPSAPTTSPTPTPTPAANPASAPDPSAGQQLTPAPSPDTPGAKLATGKLGGRGRAIGVLLVGLLFCLVCLGFFVSYQLKFQQDFTSDQFVAVASGLALANLVAASGKLVASSMIGRKWTDWAKVLADGISLGIATVAVIFLLSQSNQKMADDLRSNIQAASLSYKQRVILNELIDRICILEKRSGIVSSAYPEHLGICQKELRP